MPDKIKTCLFCTKELKYYCSTQSIGYLLKAHKLTKAKKLQLTTFMLPWELVEVSTLQLNIARQRTFVLKTILKKVEH